MEDKKQTDQEPFSLFLSSSRDRPGRLNLKIAESKKLRGKWNVSLRDISYKRQRYEEFVEEPIYYLFLTTNPENVTKLRKKSFPYVEETPKETDLVLIELLKNETVPGFTNGAVYATLRTRSNDCDEVTATPYGFFNIDEYIGCLNGFMTANGYNWLTNGSIQLESGRTIIYPGGYSGAVKHDRDDTVVVPIFGPKTRKLLCYPEFGSPDFINMLRILSENKRKPFALTKNNLKAHQGDLVVTCNVAEENGGILSAPHSYYDNRILRFINQSPNIHTNDGDPCHHSFDCRNKIHVPIKEGIYDEVNMRILYEDTGDEVVFNDSIRATIDFEPPCNASESGDSCKTDLICTGEKAGDLPTPLAIPYRKKMTTTKEPGMFYTTIPRQPVYTKKISWDEFIKPA